MSEQPRNPEMYALWMELEGLLPRGPSPRAEEILNQLRQRAEQLKTAGDPDATEHLSAVCFSTGALAMMANNTQAAETAFLEGIEPAQRALEAQPDNVSRRDRLASLHYNLGNVYSSSNRMAESETEYRAAIPLQEQSIRDRPNTPYLRNHLAQTRFNLGNTCMALRRPAEAAECFRSARELWLRLVEEEPKVVGHAHNLARSYFNFAYVAGQNGLTPEVEDAYRQAQQTWERLLREFGEDAEQRCDVARCYFNHGLTLAKHGRHEEALPLLERALPHFERLVELVPSDANFANLRQQASQYRDWLHANQPAELCATLLTDAERRAAPARTTQDGRRLRQIGESLMKRTGEYLQSNRPVEMERVYRAAAGLIGEAARLDSKPDTAHLEAALIFDLNIDLRELRCYDSAEEAVRGAIRRWHRLHTQYPDDQRFRHWLAGARNNLGLICADTGRTRAAEEAYRVALAMREEGGRNNPADAENQLYLGGALCNLGNVYLSRGELATARDFYERAVRFIEPTQAKLPGNQLVGQFLKNCRDGLHQCEVRVPLTSPFVASASASWAQPGPPALTFYVTDATLAAELRAVDALRLAGDIAAEQRTAALVSQNPDSADAWFLRGLVLGHFCTEKGGEVVRWNDSQHEESTVAFYETLVLRPDDYAAKLYKGLALRQAAHAAQAGLRAIYGAVESLPEREREGHLAPRRERLRWDIARARESLEAAARLRPTDGRALYELVELYHGLGYRDQAWPYLERLKKIDPTWGERAQAELDSEE